ncbi:ATP/GTP-binding protein [Luedemannella flava]|uniref:ATP/GTP-binding protein n=1 Tax=Luedemannella flava TaxID=349316 RepID=A0ABN2LPN4_9ACTN
MYERSDQAPSVKAVKIIVSGGFGVGKTTFVGAISDIEPLATEAELTEVSVGIDDTSAVAAKSTTTVALDFGRIRLDDSLVLYLFGTPGQDRFAFLWDDLVVGALGAVVMVDTRRVMDSFAALDYLEDHGIPFLLAINRFDGAARFDTEEIREALRIGVQVPILEFDARVRDSVKHILLTLIEQVLIFRLAGTRTPAPAY